jgi:hypothetical protein
MPGASKTLFCVQSLQCEMAIIMEYSLHIKFCVKLRKMARATCEMLKYVFEEESLDHIKIFKWFAQSKKGRISIAF